MILNSNDFNNSYNRIFPQINTNTLSVLKTNRIRIELGANKKGKKRVEQCLFRCDEILKYCFGDQDIWIRTTLWSDAEKENLVNAGFKFNKADLIFEENREENHILFIYKRQYSLSFFNPIILSIINYEINEVPFANITCYFINFSTPLIINIYDDRGMDIMSSDKDLFKRVQEHFKAWIIFP